MKSNIIMVVGLVLTTPSVLAGQDTLATTIQYGQLITGQLTTQHPAFDDGSFYQVFEFVGASGDSVSVTLNSEDLDGFLILSDMQGQEISRDADSGGSCNAHISAVLPDSGWYAVYAAGTSAGEWGDFTLALQRGMQPAATNAGCRGFVAPKGILSLGDSVTSSLDRDDLFLRDSTYYEVWLVGNTSGKAFTIDYMSKDVDAVLMLLRGFGRVVAVDDDSGSGCDARIVYDNAAGAPLRLVARTRGDWQMGSFVLRLSEGAEPPGSPSACEGRPAGQPPARR